MPMNRPSEPGVEVVVARYAEDLRWTGNLASGVRCTVYNKGVDEVEGARRLPNVGREAHTYLHHLVEQYDRLAPVTVFCQGHPFDHAPDLHRVVRRLAEEGLGQPFLWLGFLVETEDRAGRRSFARWSKNPEGRGLELDRFHRVLFGTECPPTVQFYGGAQFAVTRECLWRRPREWFVNARKVAVDFPDGPHCFERMWDRVFGVEGVPPEVAARGETVYLKPIRPKG
jgi:hypothetical protein